MKAAYLSLDQGTTSTRAMIFDIDGKAIFTAQQEFPQIYPDDGWVEHDPEMLWQTSFEVMQTALDMAQMHGHKVKAMGITNQRETTIIWNRQTGKPIYNAIVWQDRRTSDRCQALVQAGHEALVSERAGLVIDPYFSASKISWILDNVEGARNAAEAGDLAFG